VQSRRSIERARSLRSEVSRCMDEHVTDERRHGWIQCMTWQFQLAMAWHCIAIRRRRTERDADGSACASPPTDLHCHGGKLLMLTRAPLAVRVQRWRKRYRQGERTSCGGATVRWWWTIRRGAATT
jgi:hypothetical protein